MFLGLTPVCVNELFVVSRDSFEDVFETHELEQVSHCDACNPRLRRLQQQI